MGEPADEAEVRDGLAKSARVLKALEDLCPDTPYLTGDAPSLADLHLAPMTAYFAAAPEGAAILADHPKLAAWHQRMAERSATAATDPLPIRHR
jgi:glutathione S-transferase